MTFEIEITAIIGHHGYDQISGFGMQHVGQSEWTEKYYNFTQAFIPPFGLHGEIGHDSKLDNRSSRWMPHMNFGKNLWLVPFGTIQ